MNAINLANVTWTYDRLADGTIHAYAWQVDAASSPAPLLASVVGPTKVEASQALYRALAATYHAKGRVIVSANGGRLAANGELKLFSETEISDEL